MGYDLHITKGDWWEQPAACISRDAWLALVEADPDLRICEKNSDPETGRIFVLWFGVGAPSVGNWVEWKPEGIRAREQGDAFLGKLYEIAESFGAVVQGDEGEVYQPDGDQWVAMDPPWFTEPISLSPLNLPQGFRPGLSLLGALGCWTAGLACGWLFMLLEGFMGGRHWLATGISITGVCLFAASSIFLVMGVSGWGAETKTKNRDNVRGTILAIVGVLCAFIAWRVLDHLGPRSGGLGRVRDDWTDWRDQLFGWASVGLGFLALLPLVIGFGFAIEGARFKWRKRNALKRGHDGGAGQ